MDRYRRMALAALVSLTAGIDPAKPSQELTGKLREADLQVTRLPPSAFPELPKSIRRELERRGCTIPQVWADKKPQNVIKGEFTRKGQTDWAVLCSLNRVSTILIFRNASEQHPSELARESDIDKLQGVGGDAIGYSRAISPVGQQFINSFSITTAFMGDPNRPQSITKGLTMPSWKRHPLCITSMQANGFN